MNRAGASAFVYAKASGMVAKSFVGERAHLLFDVQTISELWSLLFHEEVPLVPESILAKLLEEKAEDVFLSQYAGLLNVYDKPDAVLIQLLRSYDYHNIKMIAAALCDNQKNIPKISDLSTYTMLNYKKWPNFAQITAGSTISWYNTVPEWETQQKMDTRLDLQYAKELWAAIHCLSRSEREPVQKFLQEQLVIENIIWAIRLRVYYDMSSDEIIQRLAFATDYTQKNDPLASAAVHILDYALDSWEDWKDWKYAHLLNPHEDGAVWTVDPRWVQRSANVYRNKKALTQFRRYPFTPHVLVTWFYIKEHELNCIRTAAEGLRLNTDSKQTKQFVGLGV